jgi:hypothetical protein
MSRPRKTTHLVAGVLVLAGILAGVWFCVRAALRPPVAPENTADTNTPEARQLDDLVQMALDRDRGTYEREAAIRSLAEAKAVDHLLRLLPPAGDYGGVTLTAIEALGDVGDPGALPALRRVRQNPPEELVSGEFWSGLEIVIRKLERSAS